MSSIIGLEDHGVGSYRSHSPAIFPDVLIPECGLMQADITLRTGVSTLTEELIFNGAIVSIGYS